MKSIISLFVLCFCAWQYATGQTCGTSLPADPAAAGYIRAFAGGGVLNLLGSGEYCDDCSKEFTLPFRYVFDKRSYSKVFINSNGCVSFNNPVYSYSPVAMPNAYYSLTPMIAPRWADVDIRNSTPGASGDIWYKMTRDSFIVIWHKVRAFPATDTNTCTFGLVLVDNSGPVFGSDRPSDRGIKDIVFKYGSPIGWAYGAFSGGDYPQAGFDAGDGANAFNQFGTLSPRMMTLYKDTCVNYFAKTMSFNAGTNLQTPTTFVEVGNTYTYELALNGSTNYSVNTNGICGVTYGAVNSAGNLPINVLGSTCNVGRCVITANVVSGTTTTRHTIRFFVRDRAPVISYPDSLMLFAGKSIDPINPVNTGGFIPPISPGSVIDIAGTGVPGDRNGAGLQAGFRGPGHLAIDYLDNIFVRDRGNQMIRKIDPMGNVSNFVTDNAAYGSIYIDGEDKVYVPANDTVYTYNPDGSLYFAHKDMDLTPGEQLYGYTIDWQGRSSFVSSPASNRINRGTPTGTLANSFGVAVTDSWATGFNKPTHVIYVLDMAVIYVLDNNGTRISEVTLPNGIKTTVFSDTSYHFDGLGIWSSDLYAVSARSKSIYRIIPGGIPRLVAGGPQSGLKAPVGIVVDLLNNIYVSDSADHKIKKINIRGYSITPALPAGLTFDGATGTISGMPTAITAPAIYTISAANSTGSSSKKIFIEVDSLIINGSCNSATTNVQIKRSSGISTSNYIWSLGNCPGSVIQTSPSLTVTPSSLTTYSVKPAGRPGIQCRSFKVAPNLNIMLSDTLPAVSTYCLSDNNNNNKGPVLVVNATNAAGYQWQKDGLNIPGANGPTYVLPTNDLSDSGSYRVVLSNTCTSTISSATKYILYSSPKITGISDHDFICPGGILQLYVAAENTLGYQWLKNGLVIPGANSAVYCKNTGLGIDTGYYKVRVQGLGGCTDSATTYIGTTLGFPSADASLTALNSGPVCAGSPLTLNITQTLLPLLPSGSKVALVNGLSSGGTNDSLATNTFTYDFWAKPFKQRLLTTQSNTAGHTINNQSLIVRPLAGMTAAISGAGISVGINGISVFDQNDRGAYALLVYDTVLTGWNHVAVVFNNKTPTLYINGTVRKTGATSNRTTVKATVGLFGENTTTNQNMYQGLVDNLRLWPASLTLAEINTIRSNETQTTINSKNAAALFTFNNTTEDAIRPGKYYALTSGYIRVERPIVYTWLPLQAGLSVLSDTSLTQRIIAPETAGFYSYMVTASVDGCRRSLDTATITVVGLSNVPVADSGTSKTIIQPDATSINYTDNKCNPIATIMDASGGNELGNTSCTMVKDATVQTFNGQPYLQRHFDIVPASNGPAHVKLYFTQAEFTAYNTWITSNRPAWPKMPVNSNDAAGIANISITQYHGLASTGASGPGGRYNVNQRELIPNNRITTTWNGNYWTMSFPVTGFSGFYFTTNSASPLAIKLHDIRAKNEGSTNRIDWVSEAELNSDRYILERSGDGKHFNKLTELLANGKSSTYTHWDVNPLIGSNYYRLQMVESNGNNSYSKIVSAFVQDGEFHVAAYPNPAKDALTVKAFGKIMGTARITITDASGMMVRAVVNNEAEITIHLDGLAAGIYFLHYRDNVNKKVIKITKL